MSGKTYKTPEPRTPSSMQASAYRGQRTEKRILIGGHWVRPSPESAMTLAWLKGESGSQIRQLTTQPRA